jgi:BirA family transcriptional regulator, biotin operon repressor / biotin---[acetyl-CoA-carboxylase] ligase
VTRLSEDRRISVLDALRNNAAGVSGEQLAGELGVSRVAVRKHIEALRDLGYGIEARSGEGYRLLSSPDAPIPLEVRPRLHGSFVTRIEGGGTTGSTNDDARDLAISGAPEGTVVLAREQTKGRGRLGREWTSPDGGVYTSMVLRPEVELPDAVVLPLVFGLGVAQALDRFGVNALLKWPNDLLAPDGRKLAGVLLEGLSEGWRVSWVVAGVGVNVRETPAGPNAVSVDELAGRHVPLAEVAAAVLDGVGDAYEAWKADGFERLREAYGARAWLTGREVTVSDAGGRVIATGSALGIDAQGRLLVQTASGVVPISSGEVTLRVG